MTYNLLKLHTKRSRKIVVFVIQYAGGEIVSLRGKLFAILKKNKPISSKSSPVVESQVGMMGSSDRQLDKAAFAGGALLALLSLLTGVSFYYLIFGLMIVVAIIYFVKNNKIRNGKKILGLTILFALGISLYSSPTLAAALSPQTGKELYKSLTSSCSTCSLLQPFLAMTDNVGKLMFDNFGPAFANLIGYSLVLWLLFQAAKMIAPYDMLGNAGTGVVGEIIKRLIVALICITMLTGGYENAFVIKNVAKPLLTAGMNIGYATMSAVSATPGAVQASSLYKGNPAGSAGKPGYNPAISTDCTASVLSASPTNPYDKLNCFINGAQKAYGTGMAVGFSLMYYLYNAVITGNLVNVTTNDFGLPIGIDFNDQAGNQFFGGILAFFLGTILTVFYFLLFMFFLLTIFDFVFKFTYIIAISPLLIAAFVFPVFRKASTTGLQSLFNAAVKFWIQSIVMVMGAMLITSLIPVALPIDEPETFDSKTLQQYVSETPDLQSSLAIATGSASLNAAKWGVNPQYTFDALFVLMEGTTGFVFGIIRVIKVFFIFMLGAIFIGFMMRKAAQMTDELVGNGLGAVNGMLSGILASGAALGVAATAAVATAGASLAINQPKPKTEKTGGDSGGSDTSGGDDGDNRAPPPAITGQGRPRIPGGGNAGNNVPQPQPNNPPQNNAPLPLNNPPTPNPQPQPQPQPAPQQRNNNSPNPQPQNTPQPGQNVRPNNVPPNPATQTPPSLNLAPGNTPINVAKAEGAARKQAAQEQAAQNIKNEVQGAAMKDSQAMPKTVVPNTITQDVGAPGVVTKTTQKQNPPVPGGRQANLSDIVSTAVDVGTIAGNTVGQAMVEEGNQGGIVPEIPGLRITERRSPGSQNIIDSLRNSRAPAVRDETKKKNEDKS